MSIQARITFALLWVVSIGVLAAIVSAAGLSR
jgi:hypothetical protein